MQWGYFLPTFPGSTGMTVDLSRVYLSGTLCLIVKLYPGFWNHCHRRRKTWRCGMLPNF